MLDEAVGSGSGNEGVTPTVIAIGPKQVTKLDFSHNVSYVWETQGITITLIHVKGDPTSEQAIKHIIASIP